MARPQVLTQTIEKLTAGENNMSPKQLLLQSKVRKVYNPSSTSVYYSRDGKLVHSNSECTSPGKLFCPKLFLYIKNLPALDAIQISSNSNSHNL